MKKKNQLMFCLFMAMGGFLLLAISCEKDDNQKVPTEQLPKLTTTEIVSLSQTQAVCGGNITSEGISSVTARGVCWSKTSKPTITDNKTADGHGIGSYESTITGLTMNTKYYVRAYATNSAGTSYGNEISFTTLGELTIGQNYLGGIIGYIFKPGDFGYVAGETHGIVISSTNSTAQWGCKGTEIAGAYGTDLGDGPQNTLDILAGCPTPGIAAALASATQGWFLPSYFEIALVYGNRDYITGFSPPYWSSTEEDANRAWAICSTGGVLMLSKDMMVPFRAIRFF